MTNVRTVRLSPADRARAVARVYARTPRRLRLTPGQLAYIADLDAARRAAAAQNGQPARI